MTLKDKIPGGKADKYSLEEIAEKHEVSLSVLEKQFLKGIKVELEHTDDIDIAKEIAMDHLFEMYNYYDRLETMEKKNAKDWAKTYRAKIIEQGVCQYEDETILIKNEALYRMAETFKGRPVIIDHDDINPGNMEEKADGYVSKVYLNEPDGAFWADFLVFTDKGKKAIEENGFVSCAYAPNEFGKGGTWHNVSYNREILNGEYTHLAIVADPRYEDARIYENSKKKEKKSMFKLFKTEKKELQNSNDAVVELEGGVEIPLNTLVENFQNAKAKKNECDEKEKMNMDDEVEIDGEKVKVSTLIKAYKSEMKNSDEEDGKENEKEESEEDEKKNESDEDEKEEEKKNSNFKKLEEKAKQNSFDTSSSYESSYDKMARGQARYGSQVKPVAK